MIDVKLYKIDNSIFEDPARFEAAFIKVSSERQEKINRIKPASNKYKSLGAGLLFEMAMDDLQIAKDDRELSYGENGKPELANRGEIQFSISHSDKWSILVINTEGMSTGCDIEKYGEAKKARNVFKRVISTAECELWFDNDVEGNDSFYVETFYNIWTAKESYVKTTGKGLGTDFRKLELQKPGPDGISVINDTDSKTTGYISRVNIDEEYSLSICTPVRDIRVIEI